MAASIRATVSRIASVKRHFTVPERLKKGLPKKIGVFLEGLYSDYKAATVDVINDIKERPGKAGLYVTLLGLTGVLWNRTPDEEDFERDLVEASNDLLLLSNTTRNPDSDNHVQRLLALRNAGVLRYMSLGVFSIVWEDNYDRRVASYNAKCDYLKVSWRALPDRVRDVGFLGQWWYIRQAMVEFDINYLDLGKEPINFQTPSYSDALKQICYFHYTDC